MCLVFDLGVFILVLFHSSTGTMGNIYSKSELKELCLKINQTDFKIKELYHLLPAKEGNKLLTYLGEYDGHFTKLTNYILSNNTVTEESCQYVLKPGAARYFYALYDDELLKYYFKWTAPYAKNKGKYEEMLDFRVNALELWSQLHGFLGLSYFDFYMS